MYWYWHWYWDIDTEGIDGDWYWHDQGTQRGPGRVTSSPQKVNNNPDDQKISGKKHLSFLKIISTFENTKTIFFSYFQGWSWILKAISVQTRKSNQAAPPPFSNKHFNPIPFCIYHRLTPCSKQTMVSIFCYFVGLLNLDCPIFTYSNFCGEVCEIEQ